jgi:hypothetical protein
MAGEKEGNRRTEATVGDRKQSLIWRNPHWVAVVEPYLNSPSRAAGNVSSASSQVWQIA